MFFNRDERRRHDLLNRRLGHVAPVATTRRTMSVSVMMPMTSLPVVKQTTDVAIAHDSPAVLHPYRAPRW